jgi:hypothetical protein
VYAIDAFEGLAAGSFPGDAALHAAGLWWCARLLLSQYLLNWCNKTNEANSMAFSPQANYTD